VRDKSAKFIELANKRVNRAIRDLRLVANLSNRQNYEYSDDQGRKIVKVLQAELEGLKRAFQTSETSDGSEFRL